MNYFVIVTSIIILFGFALSPQGPIIPGFISIRSVNTGDTTINAVSYKTQTETAKAPLRIQNDSIGVSITAASAIAVDKQSNAVLWEKNPDDVRPIASITKLATLLTALEKLTDLDTTVTISKEDYSSEGTRVFKAGDTVSIRDAVAAIVMASDNTAAQALARSTSIPFTDFVARMNDKIEQLGLKQTKFQDVTGLSGENVSTARDVILLAKAAFSNPLISSFAGKKVYDATYPDGRTYHIRSTDALLGGIITVVAGKTGYVNESGYNLVAESTRDGHAILAVVLGSVTNDDRFQDYKMLVYWAWQQYRWQ